MRHSTTTTPSPPPSCVPKVFYQLIHTHTRIRIHRLFTHTYIPMATCTRIQRSLGHTAKKTYSYLCSC